MSCICYREIYSAAPCIPAVVISIIVTYSHTISDREFDKLQFDPQTIRVDGVDGVCGNTHKNTWRASHYPAVAATMWIQYDIGCIVNLGYIHRTRERDELEVSAATNIYEFLHSNFSSKTDESRHRREALWKKLQPNMPMPQMFATLCDTLLDNVDTMMFSEPPVTACSWEQGA